MYIKIYKNNDLKIWKRVSDSLLWVFKNNFCYIIRYDLTHISDADQIPGNVWQSGSGGYRNNESFLLESYRNYCTETHRRDLDVYDGCGEKNGWRPRNECCHL